MFSVQVDVQQQMVAGNRAKNGDTTGSIDPAAAVAPTRSGSAAIPRLRK
jgi:hypothetical protein